MRFRIVFLDGVFLLRFRRELVANLAFVTVLEFAGNTAEEDAAVAMIAVADAVELQDEVGPLAFRLKVAGAVVEVYPTLFRDIELRLLAGKLLPAGQVFAVEKRLRIRRLELDVAITDVAAGKGDIAGTI